MRYSYSKFFLSIILIMLIISCENVTVDDRPIKSGKFIVLPVEGLYYETSSLNGKTDKKGAFLYKEGEAIKFKIGNLLLGEGLAIDIMSPLTLFDNTSKNISINIARLLLTLDENNNNGVAIKIPDALDKLELDKQDFATEEGLNNILQTASTLTSKSYRLVESDLAESVMNKYIKAYSFYKPIDTNYYFSTYNEYHLLVLEEDTNVFFTQATCPGKYCFGLQSLAYPYRYVGLAIYDLDLNGGEDQGSRIRKYTKGTYIVKTHHSPSGNYVAILYPEIISNATTFALNKNGRYTGDGVTFYTLDIDTVTKVRFTTDDFSNSLLTNPILFDSKLNIIKDMSEGGDYDVTLSPGNYIFVYDHYDDRKNLTFLIFSMGFKN